MLFPIFFGHLTFASHRCWTIIIKKGVFLAAEAWRQEYEFEELGHLVENWDE